MDVDEFDPPNDELRREVDAYYNAGLAAVRREMPRRPRLLRSTRLDDWRLRRAAGRATVRHRVFLQDTTWEMNRTARRVDEEDIERIWGASLRRLHALFSLLDLVRYDVLRLLVENPDDDSRRLKVILELYDRSLVVAAEVKILIERGYPHGAMARWRSLYELSVVLTVATRDEETATRYIDHQAIGREREARHLAETTPRITGHELTPDQRASVEAARAKRREMEERYGNRFARPYGWAAHLTERDMGQSNPTFRTLERLVSSRGGFSEQYLNSAHEHVHAASSFSRFQWHTPTGHIGFMGFDPFRIGTPGLLLSEMLAYIGFRLAHLLEATLPRWERKWRYYRFLVLEFGHRASAEFIVGNAGLREFDVPV